MRIIIRDFQFNDVVFLEMFNEKLNFVNNFDRNLTPLFPLTSYTMYFLNFQPWLWSNVFFKISLKNVLNRFLDKFWAYLTAFEPRMSNLSFWEPILKIFSVISPYNGISSYFKWTNSLKLNGGKYSGVGRASCLHITNATDFQQQKNIYTKNVSF